MLREKKDGFILGFVMNSRLERKRGGGGVAGTQENRYKRMLIFM